jgi:hypothetical protein
MTMMKLGSQGTCDLFCGFYAIANAFGFLGCCDEKGGKLEAQHFFDVCCDETEVPLHHMNRYGIEFPEIVRLVEKCQKQSGLTKVTNHCPKKDYRKVSTFILALEEFFRAKPKSKCAIIRLKAPSDHWLVVVRHDDKGDGMSIDSLKPECPMASLDLKSLFIGKKNQTPKSTIGFVPSQTLFIEKIS